MGKTEFVNQIAIYTLCCIILLAIIHTVCIYWQLFIYKNILNLFDSYNCNDPIKTFSLNASIRYLKNQVVLKFKEAKINIIYFVSFFILNTIVKQISSYVGTRVLFIILVLSRIVIFYDYYLRMCTDHNYFKNWDFNNKISQNYWIVGVTVLTMGIFASYSNSSAFYIIYSTVTIILKLLYYLYYADLSNILKYVVPIKKNVSSFKNMKLIKAIKRTILNNFLNNDQTYVNNSNMVNAGVTKVPGDLFILISKKSLSSLEINEIIALLMHEVGHIMYYHCEIVVIYDIFKIILILIFNLIYYNKMYSKPNKKINLSNNDTFDNLIFDFCNTIKSISHSIFIDCYLHLSIYFCNKLVNLILKITGFIIINHRAEYLADKYCAKIGYGKYLISALNKMSYINDDNILYYYGDVYVSSKYKKTY